MQRPAPDPIAALEFAIQLERDGRAFYLKAAEATSDEMGKKVFSQLAREEVEHLRMLETELARLHPAGTPEGRAGADTGDVQAQTAAAEIFPAAEDAWQMGADAGDAEALRVAASSEEKGFAFYSQMARQAPEAQTREVYERLAAMEDEHRKLLQWELDYVLGSGYWCDIAQFDME